MPDLSQDWQQDLQLTPAGSLALTSTQSQLTRQSLIRRLLTTPGSYIWDPGYGAGLGRFVGSPAVPAETKGLVRAQALLENTVASVSSVTVNADGTTVSCALAYVSTDAPNAIQTLTLSVNATGATAG
jgi:phage baseplate assembly protein W